MADAGTGNYGVLRVSTGVTANAAGNYWDISWAFYLIENGGSNSSYDGGTAFSVVVGTAGTVASGSFAWDWRPGGYQNTLIASGSTRVYANSDGSVPSGIYVQGNMGSSGTSGAGGPTSVSESPSLSPLKVLPGTPTAVGAVRNSDTSATVSWSQSSASNGQPSNDTIRSKVNGGPWADVVTIAAATSVNVATAANQKIVYGVKATNSVGDTAYSADSSALFTTPAAPSSVVATKSGSDIVVTFTDNVAFAEHQHVLEHGVLNVGTGVITWDVSALAAIAAGTTSFTHTSPNAAQVHVYRLSAKNTDTGALQSATVQSNSVQLLTSPNKPAVVAPAPFQDKAAVFRFSWAHNPVDTTAQTKRQVRYSTDGGAMWTTGAKTADTNQYVDFAASTWAANVQVAFQVRTKGGYDSGSDGDASYSPWSDSISVTFKTKPATTITAPVTGSTYVQAALTVVLGFSQAEGASFVSAKIGLYASGGALIEEIISNTLAGTTFTNRVANGSSYTVKATVADSNGVTSSQVTSSFSVTYTSPVAAVVTTTYLPDSGIVQLALAIPAAAGGLVAAASVTIDRIIDGLSENIVTDYPSAASLTILDLLPTIAGDNLFKVTTKSLDGATFVVTKTVTTLPGQWAFMSKGPGYAQIIRFEGGIKPVATPTVDSALLKTAGRARSIGLYAKTGSLVVTGVGELVPGPGSTAKEIQAFLQITGKGCYRDPSGQRIFGRIQGQIARENSMFGSLSYSVEETA